MTEHRASAAAPFIPATVDPPEMTADVSKNLDWYTAVAGLTVIACGLWPIGSIVNGTLSGVPALAFAVSFAMYCAALGGVLVLPRRPQRISRMRVITLALVQSLAGLAVNVITNWYLGGTGMGLGLLVVVAVQLPYVVGSAATWLWILAQTLLMTALIWRGLPGELLEAVVFTVASLAFQVFAAASSTLSISEGRARTNLVRANAELRATRELLAESSRTAERLRISRDLHDTLGHHLTALSLQLDVASRLSDGKVAEHVQQAHAITRLLLSDVRDVVSSLRESSTLNLAEAIRALVIQPLQSKVHLAVPAMLTIDDPAKAETLLRAVQEVLTNTARHAHAANLWIQAAVADGGIIFTARDDGRGSHELCLGNGLTGMKERFEAHGGHIEFRSARGAGFEVRGLLPLSSSA